MDDFVQIALDPAVTVTVIACLTLVIVLGYFDHKRRIKRLGRMTGTLLAGPSIIRGSLSKPRCCAPSSLRSNSRT